MRDIMCSGYVAGGNSMFFGIGHTNVTAPVPALDIRNDIEKRLSFQDDASGEYSSMLAFCAPLGDGGKRDQVISISDRLLPWEVTKNNAAKEYFPGGQSNFNAARTAIGLETIHFGEDVRAAENMEFISQGKLPASPRTLTSATSHTPADRPARLYEQRPLLRGPAPQVQPLLGGLPRAHVRTSPLTPPSQRRFVATHIGCVCFCSQPRPGPLRTR